MNTETRITKTSYRRISKVRVNPRSELIQASMHTNEFAWAFDPIGNRISTEDREGSKVYTANALNQYTNIHDVMSGSHLETRK